MPKNYMGVINWQFKYPDEMEESCNQQANFWLAMFRKGSSQNSFGVQTRPYAGAK